MAFRGMVRYVGAVAVAGVLLAGCSAADAEDPEDPSPSASAEAPTDAGTASAEAGSGEDGEASGEAEADGPASDDSPAPTRDPNRPEAQLPPRPDAMDEQTVDGAIAAGKYFMELFAYVYATGDLTEWDALSGDGCEFCANVDEHVTGMYSDGGYGTGGEIEIHSADGGGPYEDGVFIVQLSISFAESVHKFPDGSQTVSPPADRPDFRISMSRRDGDWIVLGIRAQSVQAEGE